MGEAQTLPLKKCPFGGLLWYLEACALVYGLEWVWYYAYIHVHGSSVSTKPESGNDHKQARKPRTPKADNSPVLDLDPRQGILLISRKQHIHTVLGGTLKSTRQHVHAPPTRSLIHYM